MATRKDGRHLPEQQPRSLELRGGVVVSLEGSIDDLRTDVDHVGHNWLVLRTVPSHVSGLSVSVSVGGSVVLVVDGGLSGSPLSVSIGDGWVLGKDLGQVPVEQVGIVGERLGVQGVVVHHNGARVTETTAETTSHEVDDPGVGQPASHVEVLDGELSDEEKSEQAAELRARCVVGPVEVRAVNWASNNGVHVVAGEPASQLKEHTQLTNIRALRLRDPWWPCRST